MTRSKKDIPEYDADSLFSVSDEEILKAVSSAEIVEEAEAARERVFHRITQRIGIKSISRKQILFIKKYPWAIAASVFLCFSLGLYFYENNSKGENEEFDNSYIVCRSTETGISKFVLPDGSEVTLNKFSVLRYTHHFGIGRERVVELDGEGYFNIMPDSSKPFIVNTNGMEVKV